MSPSAIETLSPGIGQSGIQDDQYADGKGAKNWQQYIGEQAGRTGNYKNFLIDILEEKEARTILDAACGTGVDSVMLIEEMGAKPGFNLTSADFSDKMLKYAMKTRWERRKEQAFFNWTIEEGNWMTLTKDVKTPGGGYDAILCMGNSFPNLMDFHGDFRNQKTAFKQFYDLLRPGGILIIDHRNYDFILKHGKAHNKNIYYNSSVYKVVTQTIYEEDKAKQIVLNYRKAGADADVDEFTLSVQPYKLAEFSDLLRGVFGTGAKYKVYGDFKELSEIDDPAYFIHVIEKPSVHWSSRAGQAAVQCSAMQ